VDRLRIVFGRKVGGVPYGSIDGQPVAFFFLLIAPPNEVSNEYLPALGRIAQLAREPRFLERLERVIDAAELCAMINGKGT
jgi:mannitol/fructose-specific phosphotransferase system IIA component (Ntr-type)